MSQEPGERPPSGAANPSRDGDGANQDSPCPRPSVHAHGAALCTGRDVRAQCRAGTLDRPTAGLAPGYTQANLVVLRSAAAADFEAFCRANPRPCPLLEITAPGSYEPRQTAPGADLRTDLPRYRVYHRGVCTSRLKSVESLWDLDFVSFLIGCSFTFEFVLLEAGIPVRHIQEHRNVPMYRTALPCVPAGGFAGPLVVSMRPMTPDQAKAAHRITARMERAHGAPVHIGNPAELGITDLNQPQYGDAVTIRAGEVPVFWACGVTPLEAIMHAKPDVAITHEPGHMFVTDLLDRESAG